MEGRFKDVQLEYWQECELSSIARIRMFRSTSAGAYNLACICFWVVYGILVYVSNRSTLEPPYDPLFTPEYHPVPGWVTE